ncbi:MAG: SDR family NAD(P)-dependent oxidoreductase, partial [Spirochaetales bacterium]
MKLEGKTALVTGASRGIGKAIATLLHQEGAILGIVDIRTCPEFAEGLSKKGKQAVSFACDVTDPISIQKVVDTFYALFGKIDILVNNAGIIARESLLDLSVETWKKVLDVNLNGVFYCCKAVVPYMIKGGGGKIVNISSIAGKTGDLTAAPVYGASKGGVNAFTKSLARQLAPYRINVNAIAPHAIETEMSAEWSPEKRKEIIESIPLKRLGKPEE